jgi:hypothetical protein
MATTEQLAEPIVRSVAQAGSADLPGAEVIQHPSSRERGFLNPDGVLPYDIEVDDWSEPGVKEAKGVGKVETSFVTLTDGSGYVFRKTIPEDMKYGTSVDYTLPLSTRVKGHNTYLTRKLAQSGMHSRIVGTNQSPGFSLLHEAQATLHLLNVDDGENETCTPGESVSIGYSMGTMEKLAEFGIAADMGRENKLLLGLDPCLAKKVDYAKELAALPEVAEYLGREALEIPLAFGKALGRESPVRAIKRAAHLVQTVGITPDYYKTLYDKWNIIATGETGTFPASVPPEAAMVVHFFGRCRYNDFPIFKEFFKKGHPNVHLLLEDGFHLSGVDSAVVKEEVKRTAIAQELLAQKVAPGAVAQALSYPILHD